MVKKIRAQFAVDAILATFLFSIVVALILSYEHRVFINAKESYDKIDAFYDSLILKHSLFYRNYSINPFISPVYPFLTSVGINISAMQTFFGMSKENTAYYLNASTYGIIIEKIPNIEINIDYKKEYNKDYDKIYIRISTTPNAQIYANLFSFNKINKNFVGYGSLEIKENLEPGTYELKILAVKDNELRYGYKTIMFRVI